MKELLILLTIYIFFLAASVMAGVGVHLIAPQYAKYVTGAMIELSTFAVIWQFFKEFGGK